MAAEKTLVAEDTLKVPPTYVSAALAFDCTEGVLGALACLHPRRARLGGLVLVPVALKRIKSEVPSTKTPEVGTLVHVVAAALLYCQLPALWLLELDTTNPLIGRTPMILGVAYTLGGDGRSFCQSGGDVADTNLV